jgi:glycosyltransferase involved in cell wall biosynthesis
VNSTPKLLVLDTAFSYEAIVQRMLFDSILCRDLDGFFTKVFSVHPFSSLVTSSEWGRSYGPPDLFVLSNSHIIIEGKFQRYKFLRSFTILNFVIAQVEVFIYLFRLIRTEKIAIIRAGDPLYLGVLGFLLCRFTNAKLVVRVGSNNDMMREITHQCVMPKLFKYPYIERLVERFILKRANLVAAANRDNLDFSIRRGAKKEQATIFRYGNLIDKRHFTDPLSRSPILDTYLRGLFALCIARHEKVKKVGDIILALAEIRQCGHDIRAVLVGDGSERGELERLASKLGVRDFIEFCGNRDQEWLSRVIPMAAVVISPHTGRALGEAALGAAPIVAYDVDWQSEIIESGQTGELVPFGDIKALAEATIKLIVNRSYARFLGTRVRERALSMLDREALNSHERTEYGKLLV